MTRISPRTSSRPALLRLLTAACLVLAIPEAPRAACTSEPFSLQPAWILQADQQDAEFGRWVASAGDVDGDGLDDVLVGAFLYENGESAEGAIFLFRGTTGPGPLTPAWILEGGSENSYLHLATGVGDLNGDGFDEVAVTEYAVDARPGAIPPTRVLIYSGSPSGPEPVPATTLWEPQLIDLFGRSVTPAGDFDGDGCGDLIVGAPLHDDGQSNEGAAFIFRGGAFPAR